MGLCKMSEYTMSSPDAASTSTSIGIKHTFEEIDKKYNTENTENPDHFLHRCHRKGSFPVLTFVTEISS